MVDVPYYGDITSSDMSYKINLNQKFVREIRIDDVTKTEEHLLITKVQNSFDILKYLKEIIMLNSTKEGIVVQFLPEAKDFGVSLNQVL